MAENRFEFVRRFSLLLSWKLGFRFSFFLDHNHLMTDLVSAISHINHPCQIGMLVSMFNKYIAIHAECQIKKALSLYITYYQMLSKLVT